MVQQLDFTKLPTDAAFTSRSMWATLPQPLEARLATLPHTLERLQAAVMFAEQSARQSEPRRAAAFLRAALAEFRSMEDMQEVDKPSSTCLDLINLNDPLLHLLKLLRDLNIHEKTVKTIPHSVPASFDNQSFSLNVFVISNLRPTDFAALKNRRHYSSSDLQAMITWFEKAQLHWGAGYIVRLGAESLGEAICKHYGH